MLGNLISGFITIVIGVNLIGPIADDVFFVRFGNNTASATVNINGAASTILGLTPLFFSLGVMSAGVALAIGGLRNAGLV